MLDCSGFSARSLVLFYICLTEWASTKSIIMPWLCFWILITIICCAKCLSRKSWVYRLVLNVKMNEKYVVYCIRYCTVHYSIFLSILLCLLTYCNNLMEYWSAVKWKKNKLRSRWDLTVSIDSELNIKIILTIILIKSMVYVVRNFLL